MWDWHRGIRRGLQAALVAALAATAGCGYAMNRYRDALDCFDIGFTVSPKPQFGLYANCPFTAPVGYTHVDGYYAGIGAGGVGIMKQRQRAAGILVAGQEDVTWGDSDDPEGERGYVRSMAPFGIATEKEGDGTPTYKPQCAHYFHLGFIGVTANLNYKEWPDAFLGWVGLDTCKDDDRDSKETKRPAAKERLVERSARLRHRHDGLLLLARTDKASYTMDEPISLDIELANCSGQSRTRGDKPRDVSVYFEPVAKTAGGERAEWLLKFFAYEVVSGRLCYASPRFEVPAAQRGDLYHHVTLPPNAFVGRRFTFAPASQWLEPGDYFFLVSYQVGDESGLVILHPELTVAQAKALGNDLAYTRVWTGHIFSDAVVFHVGRKKVLGLF
jgi:hypothetical protein